MLVLPCQAVIPNEGPLLAGLSGFSAQERTFERFVAPPNRQGNRLAQAVGRIVLFRMTTGMKLNTFSPLTATISSPRCNPARAAGLLVATS